MIRHGAYRFTDDGRGDPPVICLHGIGGNADSFGPQREALAGVTRVLAWNMPGYAGTASPPAFTFEALAGALAGLLDSQSINRTHLIGHSIGGMVAQEFALRWPERVVSLSLLGATSAFGGRDETFKAAFIKARIAPLDDGKSMAELAAELVPGMLSDRTDPEIVGAAVASMAAVPHTVYRRMIECLVTFNRYHDIASLSMPCCIIAGEDDKIAPPPTLEKMAARIPSAELHVVPGAGHLFNLEKPGMTNRILMDFLSRHL